MLAKFDFIPDISIWWSIGFLVVVAIIIPALQFELRQTKYYKRMITRSRAKNRKKYENDIDKKVDEEDFKAPVNQSESTIFETIGFGRNQFKVFKNPMGQIEVVKIGFSFPALILTLIWLIYKKLYKHWGIYLIFCIISIAISLDMEMGSDEEIFMWIIDIGAWIYVAWNGNRWFSEGLFERGYQQILVVNADSQEGAKAFGYQHLNSDK